MNITRGPVFMRRDLEQFECIFGKYAAKVRGFVEAVDFDHPDFDKTFGEFLKLKITDLVHMAKHRPRSMPSIEPIAKKHIPEYKNLNDPFETGSNLRFIKCERDREAAREYKEIVYLSSHTGRIKDMWNNVPDDFDMLARNSDIWKKEFDEARRKVSEYRSQGLDSMADLMGKAVQSFRNRMEDAHYGHKRCSMLTAATVLAKKWARIDDDNIIVPNGKFKKISAQATFEYAPRVYPTHKLLYITPQRTGKLMEYLEKYSPEACNKPIFDCYWVVIPSIRYPMDLLQQQSVESVDLDLLDARVYDGVLLGEKDDKCYYIGDWE